MFKKIWWIYTFNGRGLCLNGTEIQISTRRLKSWMFLFTGQICYSRFKKMHTNFRKKGNKVILNKHKTQCISIWLCRLYLWPIWINIVNDTSVVGNTYSTVRLNPSGNVGEMEWKRKKQRTIPKVDPDLWST